MPYPLVELLDDVLPRLDRQLRVEHARLDRELLEEQLELVAPVDVVDEDDRFTPEQPELQQCISDQVPVVGGALDRMLQRDRETERQADRRRRRQKRREAV